MVKHVCATCKRGDVRLYRPYGEFLREERILCNSHIENFAWMVPLVESLRGDVWGYTSAPPDDVQLFESKTDADPSGKTWANGGWE